MNNKIKTLIGVLCLSLSANVILTGVNFIPRSSKYINITDFPMNYSCLMDSNRYLIKNKIYGKTCYNPWLDLSIIDLRYYKNGKMNLTNFDIIL